MGSNQAGQLRTGHTQAANRSEWPHAEAEVACSSSVFGGCQVLVCSDICQVPIRSHICSLLYLPFAPRLGPFCMPFCRATDASRNSRNRAAVMAASKRPFPSTYASTSSQLVRSGAGFPGTWTLACMLVWCWYWQITRYWQIARQTASVTDSS